MSFTIGDLRAAIDGEPDHITIELPIPLAIVDGGEGYEYAPLTDLYISGDTAEVHYVEPPEWSTHSTAERAEHREDMRFSAAYLAASRRGISEALRMVLDVRLPAIEGITRDPAALNAVIDRIHEELLLGLAGAAAAANHRANPPA